MHIKLADTALNEILYQMVPYFLKILWFVENYDANFSVLHFTFFTCYPWPVFYNLTLVTCYHISRHTKFFSFKLEELIVVFNYYWSGLIDWVYPKIGVNPFAVAFSRRRHFALSAVNWLFESGFWHSGDWP